MAGEQDVLRLAATVVDGFSQPIRDMTRKLREFSDQGKTVHLQGRRDVLQHNQAWRDLRKSMLDTSQSIKQVISPAMNELGFGISTTAGSLALLARSMKGFAETGQYLPIVSSCSLLRRICNTLLQKLFFLAPNVFLLL